MGNLGFTELLFIFIIALIFFGPRKLPELGKSLGQTLGQFKRASEDFKRSWEDEVEIEKRRATEPPAPKVLPAPNAVASTRSSPAPEPASTQSPSAPELAESAPAAEPSATERTA